MDGFLRLSKFSMGLPGYLLRNIVAGLSCAFICFLLLITGCRTLPKFSDILCFGL